MLYVTSACRHLSTPVPPSTPPPPPPPLPPLREVEEGAGTTDHDSDKRLCHFQAGLGV